MQLNENIRFISTTDDSLSEHELKNEVTDEIGTFFDNVLSNVVDYFEEAIVE